MDPSAIPRPHSNYKLVELEGESMLYSQRGPQGPLLERNGVDAVETV